LCIRAGYLGLRKKRLVHVIFLPLIVADPRHSIASIQGAKVTRRPNGQASPKRPTSLALASPVNLVFSFQFSVFSRETVAAAIFGLRGLVTAFFFRR
jgi:hypothetical protein